MLSRVIARPMLRAAIRPNMMSAAVAYKQSNMIAASRVQAIRKYSSHDEESYEEFTARFEKEFDDAYDLFEVQRVLNNVFSYDLVPAPVVLEKALRAARRVNDYATASRVFEGLRYKVENKDQYQMYLDELKDVRDELGVTLKEDLFGEA